MKRILSLVLALTLLAGLLCGCGAENDTDSDPTISGPLESNIYVPAIGGAEGDFMRGADVSSLLAELNSGVTYYDFDGSALDGPGFMKLLKDCGFNWIRLRVWNDPYDENGNSYGGGNNDIDAAVTMGQWATEAGLKVFIDFHYSDFWADPSKQMVPKAWADFFFPEDKQEALYTFTQESLKKLLDGGVDVGMVQLGNETNGGMAGEVSWSGRCNLMNAGAKAVREAAAEYGKDILIAVHFTNPQSSDDFLKCAAKLAEYEVDYDVFASSYYPFWHGTTESLTAILKTVADTYGKQVMVAETSWAYTMEDGDGSTNSVTESNTPTGYYPFDTQGQAAELADVVQAVVNVGEAGVGVFYWEPAWIPVTVYDGTAESWQTNSAIWEEYGSGWASSYAGSYDPDDAGVWYGGSSWDNQALFDFEGHPLESLKTYLYVQTGTTGFDITVTRAESPTLEYAVGDEILLPETIHVEYNYGDAQDLAVQWDPEEADIDPYVPGEYTITGIAGEDVPVTCTVKVAYVNLLANPSFEDEDMSMYTLSQGEDVVQRSTDDPKSGSESLHFYSTSAIDFTAQQVITLEPGLYTFSLVGQGGDVGDSAVTYAYVRFGETELTQDFVLSGWRVWAEPEIQFELAEATEVTLGIHVSAAAKGWGTFDDWYLCALPSA